MVKAVAGGRTFRVEAEAAGERLDRFLLRSCPELGRRAAALVIERGDVRVDGRRARKGQRLLAGQSVSVAELALAPPEPEAPLVVRLERDDLVVVDKPAGQPSAPLLPGEPGSLAGALLARYPEMAGVGWRAREPGLLHRLDTRTSGLVLAARSAGAFEVLREALRSHGLAKRYLALVDGARLPDAIDIDLPLAMAPGGSGRVTVAPPSARIAGGPVSRLRTLERRGRLALVEVAASRAFRHQVRVHLAASGWPILGDREYGGPLCELLPHRHALHASHVAWAGDARVPAFAVDSSLPADLLAVFTGVSPLAGSSHSEKSS